jgi:putative restriction endonuclease
MSAILHFLEDEDWDVPLFKKLPKSDTSSSDAHGSGFVVVADLLQYLPKIDLGGLGAAQPTADIYLTADLFIDTNFHSSADVRFQAQTRSGKRTPEYRITDGYSPIYKKSQEHDFVIIQRKLGLLDLFRLILITVGSESYDIINSLAAGKNWGFLNLEEGGRPPLNDPEITEAEKHIKSFQDKPFEKFDPTLNRKLSKQRRIARSAVFRKEVKKDYRFKCAVSGFDLSIPAEKRRCEVEAAHIIPKSKCGTDDIRNGISLTQTLHWAFDQGLFGISEDRRVYVPEKIKCSKQYEFIHQFDSQLILEAKNENNRAHADAFQWHMDKVVGQWR